MATLRAINANNPSFTDKDHLHSYFETYESLFTPMKETANAVLEIGIGDFYEENGGSIWLWRQFFTNAKIYGIDTLPAGRVHPSIVNDESVVLHTGTDAYDEKFVHNAFLYPCIRFDVIIDDGPHTLESMRECIRLYSSMLTDTGMLVIEDVQETSWLKSLIDSTPTSLQGYIQIFDLRHVKNRSDDILFVINKAA